MLEPDSLDLLHVRRAVQGSLAMPVVRPETNNYNTKRPAEREAEHTLVDACTGYLFCILERAG